MGNRSPIPELSGLGRPASSSAASPSLARGVATLAVLAALLAVGHRLVALVAPAVPSLARDERWAQGCAAPVEVVEPQGARLGCASELALRRCAGLQTGDRAVVGRGGCRVERGAMAAAMRWLVGQKVDVNCVTAEELERLDGIGPRLAGALVSDRRMHGYFSTLDDLDRVKGIGPAMLRRLQPYLEVSASPGLSPPSCPP